MTNLPFDKLALAFEGLALAAQPSGIVCRIVAILGLPALRSFGDTLPALSAGVSPDSVGRRRSFPLSRPASLPRLGQLTLELAHLLPGPLGGLSALHGVPTCRLSLLCEAFALRFLAGPLRRRTFVLGGGNLVATQEPKLSSFGTSENLEPGGRQFGGEPAVA